MQFDSAKRVKNLPDNYFENLYKKAASQKTNQPIISLANGSPDLPTPKNIIKKLKIAADDKENYGYSPFSGKRNLRLAISNFYKREYGVDINPEREVAIFCGSNIGIYALPRVILNPGDYGILPDPYYPEYPPAIHLAGGKIYYAPLAEQNNFLPKISKIPNDIANKAKLIFLNYPNNPTGAIAPKNFFSKAVNFGKKHHLVVINDFAYASVYFKQKPLSLLQIDKKKEVSVELYTFSKTYSMAGWRLGFAVGNASIIQDLKKYHSHVYSTVFGAVQDAGVEALTGSQTGANKIRATYKKRRNFLISGLKKLQWAFKAPQGSFFVWVKVPKGFKGEGFAHYLFQKTQILVAPGDGFGKLGKNYIRLSLVTNIKILNKALKRLEALKEVSL